MKKIIFYLIIFKKILMIHLYKLFCQKNRFCVQIRKNIENYIVFQPSKRGAIPVESDLLGKFKSIQFLTTDNVKLYAWFIQPKKNMPVILYLHGQAESILKYQNIARLCLEKGLGLFLLSYRGHYKSCGKPSEKGFYTDVQSAVFEIKKLGFREEDIIVWGHSLGTIAALDVAKKNKIKAVILQAPIKDIKSAAIDMVRFYGKCLHIPSFGDVYRDIIKGIDFVQKFDGLLKIKGIKCPILILHSKLDRIASYTNSIELAKNNQNSVLKIFENGTHSGYSWCIDSIFEFIQSLGYNGFKNKEVEI